MKNTYLNFQTHYYIDLIVWQQKKNIETLSIFPIFRLRGFTVYTLNCEILCEQKITFIISRVKFTIHNGHVRIISEKKEEKYWSSFEMIRNKK
jgi:hypothetical protein